MQNYLHKDFFHLHFLGLPPGKSPGGTRAGGLLTGSPPGRRPHRTTTCSLTGIVKIAETVGQ